MTEVFAREQMRNAKRYILKKIFTYGLLIFGAIILIGLVLRGNMDHESFEPDRWKNWVESESEPSIRWNMMNSLREKHPLKGMTKKEVLELLGEPESKTENEFNYYLGASKRGISTGRLTILFDDNNRVSDFSVWDG